MSKLMSIVFVIILSVVAFSPASAQSPLSEEENVMCDVQHVHNTYRVPRYAPDANGVMKEFNAISVLRLVIPSFAVDCTFSYTLVGPYQSGAAIDQTVTACTPSNNQIVCSTFLDAATTDDVTFIYTYATFTPGTQFPVSYTDNFGQWNVLNHYISALPTIRQ